MSAPNAAHTPGPFRVREVHGCLYVCDADGNSLANLGGDTPAARGDACLFAAAPDKHGDPRCEDFDRDEFAAAYKAAEAAIAKAEGGQS